MDEESNPDTFDIESALPFAYGTFGQMSKQNSKGTSSIGSVTTVPMNGPIIGGGVENVIGWNNPFQSNNSNNNLGLLSPSYSRRSRSTNIAGNNKRGSMASQQDLCESSYVSNSNFLSISKYTISYLTLICFVLLANMIQMVVLYSSLPNKHNSDKKYVLIYYVFPFLCFIMLKINDINLCNDIRNLFNFGYCSTPKILNKYRRITHQLTFIGFPLLWILYSVIMSSWIQNQELKRNKTFHDFVHDDIINSVAITLWIIIQFIEFILSTICLLYCIQHNIHQQSPRDNQQNVIKYNKYSFSITNPNNSAAHGHKNRNHTNTLIKKIQLLERQISMLQTDLIQCKQENIATNSQLSNEYSDELQVRNQEYRALLSEKDLLKTELENKKSALNMKKQQCKQQQASIKQLQRIREENISTINDLKKKLCINKKEMQKLQVLLQIERQNVQKAQEYFENFT